MLKLAVEVYSDTGTRKETEREIEQAIWGEIQNIAVDKLGHKITSLDLSYWEVLKELDKRLPELVNKLSKKYDTTILVNIKLLMPSFDESVIMAVGTPEGEYGYSHSNVDFVLDNKNKIEDIWYELYNLSKEYHYAIDNKDVRTLDRLLRELRGE